MKALSVALSLCLAFFIAPAQAEFTDAEKGEAVELLEGIVIAYESVAHVGAAIDPNGGFGTGGNRALYVSSLHGLRNGITHCTNAWFNVINVRFGLPPGGLSRAERAGEWPTDRLSQMTGARSDLQNCINNLSGSMRDNMAAEPTLVNAVASLDEAVSIFLQVDLNGPFSDPLPNDWPRIIGPHGDYDRASAEINRAHHYLNMSLRDQARFYGEADVWPDTADRGMGVSLVMAGESFGLLMRISGLDANITVAADEGTIVADHAASSGLRPPEFFRALLAIELAFNRLGGANWHGRFLEAGIAGKFKRMMGYFGNATANTIDANSANPGEIERLAGRESFGAAWSFTQQFGDSWGHLDDYAAGTILFFHEIPAPPGGGGPPPDLVCGVGTTVDNGTVPPSCVSTIVCPPLPPEKVLSHSFIVNGDSLSLMAECAAP